MGAGWSRSVARTAKRRAAARTAPTLYRPLYHCAQSATVKQAFLRTFPVAVPNVGNMKTYWVANTAGDAAIKFALTPIVAWFLSNNWGWDFVTTLVVLLPVMASSVAFTHWQLNRQPSEKRLS